MLILCGTYGFHERPSLLPILNWWFPWPDTFLHLLPTPEYQCINYQTRNTWTIKAIKQFQFRKQTDIPNLFCHRNLLNGIDPIPDCQNVISDWWLICQCCCWLVVLGSHLQVLMVFEGLAVVLLSLVSSAVELRTHLAEEAWLGDQKLHAW